MNDWPQLTRFTGNEGAIACKPRSEEETFLPGQVRGGNAPGNRKGDFAGSQPVDASLAAANCGWAFLLNEEDIAVSVNRKDASAYKVYLKVFKLGQEQCTPRPPRRHQCDVVCGSCRIRYGYDAWGHQDNLHICWIRSAEYLVNRQPL